MVTITWTYAAVSWSVFSGVILFGCWYYSRDGRGRRSSNSRLKDSREPERGQRRQTVDKTKRRKEKEEDGGASEPASSDLAESEATKVKNTENGEAQLQQRKRDKPRKALPSAESSAVERRGPATVRAIDQDESDDMDVKVFAQQMSKAKTGMTLATPQQANQRIRTQKQSKINGDLGNISSNDNIASGTSSNTGADADDDLSSVASPPLEASAPAIDSSGVADMLEKASPGPSSLRITEPTQPTRPQHEKKVKKVEATETKKQRQARARREREKETMREAEAQRKALEEKQRRTAREAEGRPAKNGNGWTYASGLPANAWTQGDKTTVPKPKIDVEDRLLDTYENNGKAEASQDTETLAGGAEKIMSMIQPIKSDSTSNGSNPLKENTASEVSSSTGSSQWENGLPPEEEQMRLFQQQSEDSEWTTVPANKRSKRRPAPEQTEKAAEAQKELADFDVTI